MRSTKFYVLVDEKVPHSNLRHLVTNLGSVLSNYARLLVDLDIGVLRVREILKGPSDKNTTSRHIIYHYIWRSL